jgi:hypothetical protein
MGKYCLLFLFDDTVEQNGTEDAQTIVALGGFQEKYTYGTRSTVQCTSTMMCTSRVLYTWIPDGTQYNCSLLASSSTVWGGWFRV